MGARCVSRTALSASLRPDLALLCSALPSTGAEGRKLTASACEPTCCCAKINSRQSTTCTEGQRGVRLSFFLHYPFNIINTILSGESGRVYIYLFLL